MSGNDKLVEDTKLSSSENNDITEDVKSSSSTSINTGNIDKEDARRKAQEVQAMLANAMNNNNNNTDNQIVDAYAAVQKINYKEDTISSAAQSGNLPVCVLLWGMASAQKVNLMQPNRDGNNPLHFAAVSSSTEVINFFLTQTNGLLAPSVPLVTATNADGETPLLRAACMGYIPTLQCLLDNGSSILATDDQGNTVLHNSARNGHLWAVHFLLDYAAKQGCFDSLLQAKDNDAHRALEWACYNGHLECARYLIRQGLDPHYIDNEGRNCAHWAFKQSHAKVGYHLVAKERIDYQIKDAKGMSAYDYAIRTYRCNLAISEALIELKDPVRKILEKKAHENRLKNGILTTGDIEMQTTISESESSQKDLHTDNISSDKYSKDSTDIFGPPKRLNTTRVSFLLLFAIFTLILWGITFIIPWWSWFIICGLVAWWWKSLRMLVYANANVMQHSESLREVVLAPEKLLGFWLGSLITCLMMYPAVFNWKDWTEWTPSHDKVNHNFPDISIDSHIGVFCVLFYTSSLLAVIVWVLLVLIDSNPGAIATRDKDYDEIFEECSLTNEPPNSRKYCNTCFMKKPLRSKHCAVCGFCTARMDHHCVWLNNCVGVRNHRRFIVFIYAHWVSIVCYSIIAISILVKSMQEELASSERADFCVYVALLLKRPNFALLLQCLFALSVTIGMSMLCMEQTLNMFLNITTNERINRNRYPWLTSATGKYKNLFDKGRITNFMEFWGCTETPEYFSIYSLGDIPGVTIKDNTNNSCNDCNDDDCSNRV